ncbi:hypothetical protein Acor_65420 [Acrocarpospora corrugata]|uniref:Uncharacterized protein n=1 Tax=Acrocarpospora corrugata TaxID=35763 RepID=A0A5M3W6N9_9ACTN|nr:hypothetical protein [Acrocarpospora corrugata]GES04474.1 hypothetical protein Acor_65420 [Acrocarpospora corrugata]
MSRWGFKPWTGAEPITDDRNHALPCSVVDAVTFTGQAADDQRLDVGGINVLAYRAGLLGPDQQAAQGSPEIPVRGRCGGLNVEARAAERVADRVVGCAFLHQNGEEGEEGSGRVLVGGEFVGALDELPDAVEDDGAEQLLLRREVPAEGAGADARSPCDLAYGNRGAVFGECGSRSRA